jgi:predicted RNA-binding protein with PUA-like domain
MAAEVLGIVQLAAQGHREETTQDASSVVYCVRQQHAKQAWCSTP